MMSFLTPHKQWLVVFGILQSYLKQILSRNSRLFKVYPRDLIHRAVSQDPDPFSRASAIDRLVLISTSSSN